MGKNIEALSAPMKIGGNIDTRYFTDNGDGTYSATPAFIHNVLRDAMAYYKEQIFQLDTECMYHTEKLAEFKDTWKEKINNEQRELKYGPQLKELEARKRKWREENVDKCDTRKGGPDLGDKDELRFFAGYSPDIKPSLKQAVALYKALKEYSDEHGDSIKESIPQKPDVLLVKKEFSADYKALCDKWAEELGIPVETEEVGTITRTKYTINQLRNANMKAVASDDTGLDEYVKGLIKHLTETDKVEFKAKREEFVTLIDNDFVIEFNDSAKELKASSSTLLMPSGKEVVTSIEIWTARTEDDSPMKFITISKDDPKDDGYKYIFNVITEDGQTLKYGKPIKTKADIRKALETTICIIEDVDAFKKYIPDLERTIDSL